MKHNDPPEKKRARARLHKLIDEMLDNDHNPKRCAEIGGRLAARLGAIACMSGATPEDYGRSMLKETKRLDDGMELQSLLYEFDGEKN